VRSWQLSRQETRQARARLRETGEAAAALALLQHSIACGHGRLTVKRYLLAVALGIDGLEAYAPQFAAAAERLSPDELAKAVFEAKETSRRYSAGSETAGEAREQEEPADEPQFS
jgi:hypothetical protein